VAAETNQLELLTSVKGAGRDRIRSALEEVRAIGVIVSDQEKLSQYLEEHIQVLQAIRPIAARLAAEFSSSYEIALEFFTSHSSSESYPVFFIRESSFSGTLMDSIRRFREEFGELFSFSSGWVAVTTDFSPLRKRV
jgi:hypothetical protein